MIKYTSSIFIAVLLLLAVCGAEPTPTPDAAATQIVVEEAAHATMTAEAPTATNTAMATATLTPTPLPVIEPMPDYILEVQPAPASHVSLEWYEADLFDKAGIIGYEGSRPVEEMGHRSNICVYLDVSSVIQSGDRIMDYGDAISRAALYVDDTRLIPRADEHWFHVEILIEYPALGPDTASGAPFWLCWSAELKVGVHRAVFQFYQTDGTIQEFSWLFEITEH